MKIFVAGVVAAASLFAATPGARANEPCLTITAPRTTYALGEPVLVRYSVSGSDTIAVRPIPFCPVGEGDFALEFAAKTPSGALARRASNLYQEISGRLLTKEELRARPSEREALVTNWIAFEQPGVYTLQAYLRVLRPESGKETFVRSEPLCIRVTDGPRERAGRQACLDAAAARAVTNTPPRSGTDASARAGAIRALRTINDPRAIPILITALDAADGFLLQEAQTALGRRPDPVVVAAAMRTRLRDTQNAPKTPLYPTSWISLLEELDLRARFGEQRVADAAYAEAWRRAQIEVIEAIERRLPLLSPGRAAERRIDLISLARALPTPEELQPVLANAAQMSADSQRQLGRMLNAWNEQSGPAILRPLQSNLERLAADATLDTALRTAAKAALARL